MLRNVIIMLSMVLVLFIGCQTEQPLESTQFSETDHNENILAKKQDRHTGGLAEATPSQFLADLNVKLSAEGANVQVALAEWITGGDSEEAGKTVYFDNRGNKQLGAHWVPGDPNRSGTNNITWTIDQVDSEPNGVSTADANAAIGRAMDTWQNVKSTTIPLVPIPDYGLDWGYVQYLTGLGGFPGWNADLTHAGWLPGLFFDIIGGPGGSSSILGVTFTFIWIDTETGEPVDMDNNGKDDVAFREIYYNNYFPWGIDVESGAVDVESIVLHEAGHGLSQGHFGEAFSSSSSGKLHFAPYAVMNAGYFGGMGQELQGTDKGGHSSIWGSWPNN